MFSAKLQELHRLRRFLESFCADASLSGDDCLRVNLVLEELFTNTVRHGHAGDSDAPIWITLSTAGGALNVTYEDTAPPFNPHAGLPEFAPHAALASPKVGGLGLLLTHTLARARDYAYIYGRNRIELRFTPG